MQQKTNNNRSLERRQLTVMFCDLVNSTEIAQKLDVEAWRDFLEGYQEACSDVMRRHGGHVHEFMGDGLLVYFGYPIAHEDCAQRAVRAGLEIARNCDKLFVREQQILRSATIEPLEVRIGIHTGPVVIGEMSGRVRATGSTVAYAERLQELASPSQVVISEDTLELVKANFEVESLGDRTLKGFRRERECFLVHVEAQMSRRLSPFTGRSREMGLLREEWRSIRSRFPRVVQISGDAGIGKSRLIREFRQTLDASEAQVFEWNCSPYFQNNALYPISQSIKQTLRSRQTHEVEDDLSAIESLVPASLDTGVIAPAIAALLSVPYESKYPSFAGTPEQQRSQIEDAIVNWLAHEAHEKPILIVVEDVNWSDPSTLDLIGRLSEHAESGPILIILGFRTETSQTKTYPFAARPIALGRLSDESAREIIASSPGGDDLPEDTIDLLVERTDGVPLFIEESTAMAVDSLSTDTVQDPASLQESGASYAIPTTIQDLLTKRLGSVGSARETAQLAAVIGREFSFDLLRAATDRSEKDLLNDLRMLADAGLVLTELSESDRQYAFKHALVADAAYASMVTRDRQRLHGRIAETLEVGASTGQPAEPELLAHHFTHAGRLPSAIKYWLNAGLRAKSRSAQAEAINHYLEALQLLSALPDDTDIDVPKLELSAQRYLASCYTATDGYSSVEARTAYERAEELAETLGDNNSLLKARFGLAGYNMMRGDFRRAFDIASTCVQMAEAARQQAEDDTQRIARNVAAAQASWVMGNVLFHQAEFKQAMPHLEQCVALCQPSHPDQRRLMQDPVVMSLVYQSLYIWLAGFPDTALSTVKKGVRIAKQGGHRFSIGVALSFQACVHFFRREYQAAIDKAAESISVSEEPGFRTWLAWAKVLRGRAMSEFDDQRQDGIAEILEGLHMWDDSGAIVTRPFSLVLLAEALHLDGQVGKAIERVREAQAMVSQYGERFYVAEINWLYGKLVLSASEPGDEASEQLAMDAFLASIAFAEERDMASAVLRATIDLCKLQWAQGDHQSSLQTLESALARIGEGFDTGDYQTAKALLASMKEKDFSGSGEVESRS